MPLFIEPTWRSVEMESGRYPDFTIGRRHRPRKRSATMAHVTINAALPHHQQAIPMGQPVSGFCSPRRPEKQCV